MKSLRPYDWPRRVLSPSLNDEFDRFFKGWDVPSSVQGFELTCDVEETEDHFLLSFDLPGVKSEDIDINLDGGTLTVSGERRSESKDESGSSWIKSERSYGRFYRAFSLPRNIDPSKIEAHYEDGVLQLMLPKDEQAKGQRIRVQSGKGHSFSQIKGKERNEKAQTENQGQAQKAQEQH